MRPQFSALRIATFMLGLALPFGPAAAQFPDIDQIVKAEILPGWRESDGRHMAGLRLRLAPGWKTYWRVPGEGGIPPQFDLSGSENIASFTPHMPSPQVYEDQGMISIGYTDEVVFPMEIQTRSSTAPVRLRGVLKIGVCEAVCIPADVPLEAELSAPGQASPSVQRALGALPKRISGHPKCEITPEKGTLRLSLQIPVPETPSEYPVIETSNQEVWVATSRIWREGVHLHAVADLYPPQGTPYVFDRSGLRITVLSETGATEML
ncbi:MAG: protein-disulfide reductase DsbD domain-containing protein, partial [Pseudomonadota bacterium]